MPYIKPEDREKFIPVLEQFPVMDNNTLRYVFVRIALAYKYYKGRQEGCSCNSSLRFQKPELDSIIEQIKEFTIGDMNFMITWLTHKAVVDRGLKYVNLNKLTAVFSRALREFITDWYADDDVEGVFNSAGKEFYRRIVVPYENLKIRENGPVSDLEQELNSNR